jgi:hypothetical protein
LLISVKRERERKRLKKREIKRERERERERERPTNLATAAERVNGLTQVPLLPQIDIREGLFPPNTGRLAFRFSAGMGTRS